MERAHTAYSCASATFAAAVAWTSSCAFQVPWCATCSATGTTKTSRELKIDVGSVQTLIGDLLADASYIRARQRRRYFTLMRPEPHDARSPAGLELLRLARHMVSLKTEHQHHAQLIRSVRRRPSRRGSPCPRRRAPDARVQPHLPVRRLQAEQAAHAHRQRVSPITTSLRRPATNGPPLSCATSSTQSPSAARPGRRAQDNQSSSRRSSSRRGRSAIQRRTSRQDHAPVVELHARMPPPSSLGVRQRLRGRPSQHTPASASFAADHAVPLRSTNAVSPPVIEALHGKLDHSTRPYDLDRIGLDEQPARPARRRPPRRTDTHPRSTAPSAKDTTRGRMIILRPTSTTEIGG